MVSAEISEGSHPPNQNHQNHGGRKGDFDWGDWYEKT